MLNQYLAATQALLQNPPAPSTLYSTANLTTWINTARGQLAGETSCVRLMGSITTVAGTRTYAFSGITLPSGAGASGVFNVRLVYLNIGGGQQLLTQRAFEWFSAYSLSLVVPNSGYPTIFSVYGPGSTGTIYLDPVPNAIQTLSLDCACIPAPLATDADPECIPSLFTDAVPYFAAYLALMSAQRYDDAQAMYQLYGVFVQRARVAVTSGVLAGTYPQVPDPTIANKLGSSPTSQSQGNGGGQ